MDHIMHHVSEFRQQLITYTPHTPITTSYVNKTLINSLNKFVFGFFNAVLLKGVSL